MGEELPLEEMFTLFAKFGNKNSDGREITLTNCDKWMKQANVINKRVTTTDTAICFNKFKKKTINYQEFLKYIDDLAKTKNIDADQIKKELTSCGPPGATNVTKAVKTGGVDRLTDTSKYTGTHKERFDESGKGKGKSGREDTTTNTGYVGGYKGHETYDKTRK